MRSSSVKVFFRVAFVSGRHAYDAFLSEDVEHLVKRCALVVRTLVAAEREVPYQRPGAVGIVFAQPFGIVLNVLYAKGDEPVLKFTA